MYQEDIGKPYTQSIKEGIINRVFADSIPNDELVWHKDENNRLVKIIKSDGWLFQRDNELPFELSNGDVIYIIKETWHRLIKGSGDLIIEIKEVY